ncbi:MAG: hypothetical protein LBG70_01615 [Bifidobacteriaceae bacterium]|jgi:hypothetical protein|nr:hypothetical protein [Bifidobacteriaceae bacterium]
MPAKPTDTAGSRAKQGRGWSSLVLLGLGLLAVVILLLQLPGRGQTTALGGSNAKGDGARALIEVLKHQGVKVRQPANINQALKQVNQQATLVLVGPGDWPIELVDQAVSRAGRVVLIQPSDSLLDHLSNQQLHLTHRVDSGEAEPLAAQCQDLDAQAAGELAWNKGLVGQVEGCFPDLSKPSPKPFGYAVLPGDPPIAVIADAKLITNKFITAADGRAALALRSLGHLPQLVYLVALPPQLNQRSAEDSRFEMLPPWAPSAFAMLLLAGVATAFWRGRRFGPLVSENLPVVVPASQIADGLGNLYFRGRAARHAAQALRAHTVDRLADQLGLSRHDSRAVIVDRIATALGCPTHQIDELLYKRRVTTHVELVALARDLAKLLPQGDKE